MNLDVTADTKPDVVHNLNVTPWPFPENRFRAINAYDVLEHLDDLLAVMSEVHRICRPGGIVKITVPHYSNWRAFTDPTHRHYFGYSSFDYFTSQSEWSFYTRVRFKPLTKKLVFQPTLTNKVVHRLANRYPKEYEERWAWMFPAWFLYFELEALK